MSSTRMVWKLIPEAMNCQRSLEDGLFKLIEHHLTRMRRS